MHKHELLIMVPIILGMMLCPALPAGAANVTAFAYPEKNVAEIYVNDTVYAIFHYPSNSFFSKILNGTSLSYSASISNVPHNTEFFHDLQEAFVQGENNAVNYNISIINISVITIRKFFANETSAIYVKSSVMIIWLSGIFKKNGTEIVGNFSWKSFKINKHLYLMENGKMEDINFFGEGFMGMLGMPEFLQVPEISTLNFSAFNQPLSQWSRVYNSNSNMTVFTKSMPSLTIYSENLTVNGNSYSLKIISDPAYTIDIQGYAIAVGDEVYVTSPASQFSSYALAFVAGIFFIVIAGVGIYLTRRKGNTYFKPRAGFEPATFALPRRRSNQLSYRGFKKC